VDSVALLFVIIRLKKHQGLLTLTQRATPGVSQGIIPVEQAPELFCEPPAGGGLSPRDQR
jgi:hypothetical protein